MGFIMVNNREVIGVRVRVGMGIRGGGMGASYCVNHRRSIEIRKRNGDIIKRGIFHGM